MPGLIIGKTAADNSAKRGPDFGRHDTNVRANKGLGRNRRYASGTTAGGAHWLRGRLLRDLMPFRFQASGAGEHT